MKKVIATAMAGALIVAGGIGFTGWKMVNAQEQNGNKAVNVSEQKTNDASKHDSVISMEEAMEIAKGKYPGIVTDIELDRDHNRVKYEMDVLTKDAQYDIHVDAKTGEIVKAQKENDDREDRANAKSAKISINEAIKTAEKDVNGKVVSVELDREDGRLVYEAEAVTKDGQEHEVTVDANTGKVVKVEADDDDNDDDDHDEDDGEGDEDND